MKSVIVTVVPPWVKLNPEPDTRLNAGRSGVLLEIVLNPGSIPAVVLVPTKAETPGVLMSPLKKRFSPQKAGTLPGQML